MKRLSVIAIGLVAAGLAVSGCSSMSMGSGWTTLIDGTSGLGNFNPIGEANWRAEDGAIVADKATGRFIDADKVRPLNHQGRFFKVRGPINMARCPQGHPVIIQAGASDAKLEVPLGKSDDLYIECGSRDSANG